MLPFEIQFDMNTQSINILFILICTLFLSTCQSTEQTAEPPIQKIVDMVDEVRESSALLNINGDIWTLNDSGNSPFLYQINTSSGKIEKKVEIKGGVNKDWETLYADDQSVYIGDIGNNFGDRTDLRIFSIDKSSLTNGENIANLNKLIQFSYVDQHSLKFPDQKHNFDCEAMLVGQDSIFLFTKNRADKNTHLYHLVKRSGRHTAYKIDQFEIDGQVTGAALSPDGKTLALQCYEFLGQLKGSRCFIWLFSDFPGNQFFKGNSRKIDLPTNRQTEAITFLSEKQLLVSCEASTTKKAALFFIEI